MKNNNKYCGTVLFVGLPNAGKSTLLNSIIKQKISIVSPKVQTTKDQISGVFNKDKTQIIFTDTPGIIENRKFYNKHYARMTVNIDIDIDLNCIIVDLQKDINDKNIESFNSFSKKFQKNILVLNKIDLVSNKKMLEVSSLLNSKLNFLETFLISAKKNKGIEYFIDRVTKYIPQREWLYENDILTDKGIKYQISEITREKIFNLLNKEIPYTTEINTRIEDKKEICTIYQDILVLKESQKSIIIGKNGEKIKMIGSRARLDIEKLLKKKIFLNLIVKKK